MASREEELNFRVTADTKQAATNIDDLKSDVSDLEDKPHDVTVTADTEKAEAAARQLDKRLDGLTDDQKRIVLDLAAKDAQRDLDRLNRDLAQAHKFGDDEIALRIEARGNAEAKLQQINRELDEVSTSARSADREIGKIGESSVSRLTSRFSGAGGLLGGGNLFAGLKTEAASAFTAIQANVGALALGASAALAVLGAKSVNAFTETAKAAIDGAAATGLNVEQQSRWIAVADDSQVSADQLAAGLGKIGKTLDSPAWEKYGIATHDAGGQARDVNDILLDTFDMLGKITNETARAEAGNALFGKGYANIAPLIGKTRDEYEQYLGAVEKGQVVTAAEAEKAEAARLALDNLHDSVQEVSLAVGQLLSPSVAEGADELANMTAWALQAQAALEKIPGIDIGSWVKRSFGGIPNPVNQAASAVEFFKDQINGTFTPIDEAATRSQTLVQRSIDLAQAQHDAAARTQVAAAQMQEYARQLNVAGLAAKDAAADTNRFADAVDVLPGLMDKGGDEVDELTGKLNAFSESLDQKNFLLDLQDQLVRVGEAEAGVAEAAKNGGDEVAAARRTQQRETIRLQQMVLELIGMYDDIPEEKVTRILAAIDTGDLDKIDAAIAELEAGIQIPVEFVMPQTRAAFDSANIAFGQGSIPNISFAPSPVVNDNRVTNILPPSTTSPESQAVNDRIFRRRGGLLS